MAEENNNPDYNGMAQALNTAMAGFNAITTATYQSFGDAAKQISGLTEAFDLFDTQSMKWALPGASVAAAYASSDEDTMTRAMINATVSETISLGVEAAYASGLGKVIGILTGAGTDLRLNQANVDFYGWGTTLPTLFGYNTADYYYVKEYQRGEATFYEAYDSVKQELHFGTEGYDTTDFTTLKMDFSHNVTKVTRTNDGNKLEIDLRAKEWTLTTDDGTVTSGSFLEGTPDTMDAASEAIITQMYNDFKAELQLRDPNVNLDPLDTSVNNIIQHENIAKVENADKDSIYWGNFHIYQNKSQNLSEFGNGDVSIVKDNAVGNVFIQAKDPETGYVSMVAHDGITGLNTLYYADPQNGGAITIIPVTDASQLTAAQTTTYLGIIAAGNQAQLDGGSELYAKNPDLFGNMSSVFGDGETTDTLAGLMEQGKSAQSENGDIYDVTPENSDTSADGTVTYQTKGLAGPIYGPIQMSDEDLVLMATNAPDKYADSRVSAFWELHARAVANGTVSTNAAGNLEYDLPSGVYLEVINTGDPSKTVELIKQQGVTKPVGVVTAYADHFQQQVVEILDSDTNSVIVEITTTDESLNQAFTGGKVTLKYPEEFVFSEVGGYVGNIIGQQLADGDIYKSVLYSSALKTLGQNSGTVLDFLANGTETLDSVFAGIFGADTNTVQTVVQARPDLFEGFVKNLQSGVASAIGSAIVDELGDTVDIGGIGGEIFDVTAGTITTGIVSEGIGILFNQLEGTFYPGLLSNGFDFATPFYDPSLPGGGVPEGQVGPPAPNTTVGDYIQAQVFSAVAAYAGARLAGDIIEPESEVAALFGSAGSALGTAISTGAILSGNAIATVFQGIGWAGGPIGAAVGAFVGTVLGTVIGNAFGGGEETPSSWGRVSYDTTTHDYHIFNVWENGDAGTAIGQSLAQQVVDGVNAILAATHGTLRKGAVAQEIQIGMEGNEYNVLFSGGESKSFGTGADVVNYAAFKLLKSYDLVGGHMVVMRAWHNSDATNIFEFKDDIDVAEAFQAYLANPTGILAMMMDQPGSDTAQAWAAVLQRAAELELHLPHEKDLDGGWGEILSAQGVDPSLIPSLEGDTITLTDPVTGEETVIHHVIGPGYEIVRIEGTDGNDIIEVNVDGSSITYVAAGDGNDTIEGSDQSDILYGGGGDDIINGYDGNDWLHGGSGSDHIDGGLGEDLIIGAEHNDILIGGDGVDEIYGNDGDDYISAGDGTTDYLFGGAGNDTLEGNLDPVVTQNAYLYGQAGDDHLILRQSDVGNGGEGNDLIEFAYTNSTVYVTRGDGHDVVIADTEDKNYLVFDETISPNELYFKQEGNDLLILVLGEDQSVTIQNFYGTAIIPNIDIYALNAYELDGRNAILQAVALDATIPAVPTGQYNYLSEADIVAGQNDFEYLTNQNAALPYVPWTYTTSLIGGDGIDTITLGPGTAYGIGGAGNDTIQSLEQTPGFKIYAGDSGDDYLYSNDSQVSIMSGGLGNDLIDGSFANDRIYGGYGDDQIHSQNGDDVVYGGAGNDTIYDQSGYNIGF